MAPASATSPAPVRQVLSGPGASTAAIGLSERTAADALFASALQPSDDPSLTQVRRAITEARRRHGDGGCAGEVAQAFGECQETAAARMRWARTMAARALSSSGVAA